MLRLTALLLALLVAAPARAFDPETEAQVWTPVFARLPARGRFLSQLEINPRARGDFGRLSQLLVRPWLGWRARQGLLLHGGYVWVRGDARRVTNDHALWQQVQVEAAPAPGWTATARGRLEQRFLDGPAETAWRARLQLRAERALGGGPWYAAASSETFVHLNSVSGGPVAGPDQHRAYVGLGRGSAARRFEAGYQHLWQRPAGAPERRLHCLVLTTTFAPFGA